MTVIVKVIIDQMTLVVIIIMIMIIILIVARMVIYIYIPDAPVCVFQKYVA